MCYLKRKIRFCQKKKKKFNFIVMNDFIGCVFMKLKCEHESDMEFYSG